MRVSPKINRFVQKIIFSEAKKKDIPVVFIIHPTEVIELNKSLLTKSTSREGTFFSGVVRKKMKYKNLGKNAIKLLVPILKHAKHEGFKFISVSNYGKIYKKSDNNEG